MGLTTDLDPSLVLTVGSGPSGCFEDCSEEAGFWSESGIGSEAQPTAIIRRIDKNLRSKGLSTLTPDHFRVGKKERRD